ncbi:hypothetical protein [Bacillus sp. JJ1127]|uniref:hypothetical protein n=1 Tax=Bacillus sp. JJ1127 TaxID=3122952 RepID=UPI003F68B0E8
MSYYRLLSSMVMLLYFILGSLFGKHIETIVELTTKYGIYFGSIIVVMASVSYLCIQKKNQVVSVERSE